MAFLLTKYLKTIVVFPLVFLNLIPLNFLPIIAEENISKVGVKYLDRNLDSDYIIDHGDALEIIIDKDAEFITNFIIDSNGTITLPRLNRVYVAGLTINELKDILNQKYKEFLVDPNCTIKVTKYRPVKIILKGEVNKPGIYNLSRSGNSANVIPTIFDVLQKADGITIYSDLENIEIIRNDSITNGGGKKRTTINFLEVFSSGDLKNNLPLNDGDIVIVKKNKTPALQQIRSALETNLNPDTLNVMVSGRVNDPGLKSVYGSPSLNEVITIAGGTKTLKGKITFIRFDQSGRIIKRKFRYKPNSRSGSYENPFVKNNDMIFVGKSSFNVATEVISETTSPFTGLFSIYGLVKAITD